MTAPFDTSSRVLAPQAARNATESRIYLSPPHLSGQEWSLVQDALASNWIAPLGPHVEAFEREFADAVGSPYAAAVSSGTAALHLALLLVGVGAGDEVLVSTLTFAATVNPIVYVGGEPTLIDCERVSWNIDPELVISTLRERARTGRLPKAVVVAHLYGQSADIDPIRSACQEYGVALVEDAAEALGALYKGRSPGVFGKFGVYSFNGNKIITTSGGGMLVSEDQALIAHARKLSTQARDPAPHYEHSEIGFNYRMSNILAAIGRAQLAVLDERVAKRRENYEFYQAKLGGLPGVRFMPEAPWGKHSRWLTCLTIDPRLFGSHRETVRIELESRNIEARPIWKPMHLQPVFKGCVNVGGQVAEEIFANGLCLPSGSSLTQEDRARVVEGVLSVARV